MCYNHWLIVCQIPCAGLPRKSLFLREANLPVAWPWLQSFILMKKSESMQMYDGWIIQASFEQNGCPWRANHSLGDPCTVSSMPQVRCCEIHGRCNPCCWAVHSSQLASRWLIKQLRIYLYLLLTAVGTQWWAHWTCLKAFCFDPPLASLTYCWLRRKCFQISILLMLSFDDVQMEVHGLYGLLLTFTDACENILAKQLPESWGDPYRCRIPSSG